MVKAGPPIRRALLLLMGLPLLALLVTMAWDTYREYTSRAEVAYQTAQSLRSLATARAAEMLLQERATLQQLAQRPAVQALDARACDPLLRDGPLFAPGRQRLFTADAQGQPLCGGPVLPPLDMAALQRQAAFTVGRPVLNPATGRWVLTLMLPLLQEGGALRGAVGTVLDLEGLRLLPAEGGLPVQAVIGIVNGDGVIVARSEAAAQRVGRPATAATFDVVRTRREGSLVTNDFHGKQRHFSFMPVPGSDWFLFVALDHQAALAPVLASARWRLGFVALLTLALAAVALRRVRGIAGPVEALSQTMALVAAGQADSRAPLGGPAELHRLAGNLNAMLDAQVQAAAQLRLSEERFRAAFHTSPDALFLTRLRDGCCLEANAGAERLSGCGRSDLIGASVYDISIWRHPEDRQRFAHALQRRDRCEDMEVDFVARDGRVFKGLVSAQRLTVDGVPCVMSIIRDITARKAAEAQIHNLSFSDPLTGLGNRRHLMDRLAAALPKAAQTQQQGALLFVDLDDFKTLNETLGHDQGDIFLREMAQRLRQCVGEVPLLARLGGDDFVLLLEDLGAQADEAARRAETVGELVLQALGQACLLGAAADGEQRRSASLGITLFGEADDDAAEVLKRAEMAMYQAKSSGRNRLCFFEPQMQAIVSARAALELGLRRALEQQQFLLHYQPQVDHGGRIIGAEALLRWRHPCRGMVPPGEFIPLAESTGLILPIGRWVLETACDELARWAQDQLRAGLSMAVNVSARQFRQAEFVQQVRAALQRSGANPRLLKLEITESMLVANVEDVIATMNALKDTGVSFSLDDFGTGYSSLSYLKRLPLSQLKIDQGFVREILVDANDAAIAKMVIALADSMGLAVIAEGVETEAQRDLLAALGCRHYQGYLFGRPVPADQLAVDVASRRLAAA